MQTLKLGQSIKNILAAINGNFTELNNRKTYKVLYNGSTTIPAKQDGTTTTITLTDNPANYDGLILQLDDCSAFEYFGSLAAGKILKPIHNQFDMTAAMAGWNMFGYNCEILSNKRLKLSGFIYSGSPYDKDPNLDIYLLRYNEKYSVKPLTKVIGIKFN
jgi:hypothetical protein